jgi:hypothetical protein
MNQRILTTQEKRSLQDWQEHCQRVLAATKITAGESEADRDARKKKAVKDYRFFVNYYFPHYAKCECAPFHIDLANKVRKHTNLRAQARWFRGAAKSVHTDIMLPMWLKVQERKLQYRTMVLVGANNDAADNLLGDLQAELQFNQRYIEDWGEQYQLGTWQEGNFTTRDGCAHFALGIGQKPRGLRKGAFRPDLIVIDDVDDDEMVQNEPRVEKLVNWILRSLVPTMDKGQGRVLQANNLIHEKSVTAKLAEKWAESEKKIKALQKTMGRKLGGEAEIEYYVSDIPIRDAAGNPTWPAKYSKDDILQIEIDAGYAAFESEYMNNPITEGKWFLPEWWRWDKLPPVSSMKNLIAYLDGGFKNTGTSDSKALVLVGLQNGNYYVYKVFCGAASRMEMVDWHYDLYAWLQRHNAKAQWYMEEVFLLDLLYEDFAAAAKTKGFPIPLSGDTRKKPDKDLRIKALQGIFQRGNVLFNKAEETNPHFRNFITAFEAFDPPKKTKKDGPDAFEGAVHLLNEMAALAQPAIIGRRFDIERTASWNL